MIAVAFVTNYVYLPVFYSLDIISIYEYFELRFDKKIRTFATVLFAINICLYQPISMYVPILAFTAGKT